MTVLAEVEHADGQPLMPWDGELTDHPLRLPYAEPGGPARDLAWAAERLQEEGLRLVGRPQQVRTWNLSSLWRLPLEDGAAWLKCVPSVFAHEGAVLDRLAGVSQSVERHLSVIRALEVNGRIEAARAADTEQVRVLFEEIGKQVIAAGVELQDFSALSERQDRDDGRAARASRAQVGAVREAVAALV